ncbi:hypothetical protein [Vibrio coralliilyticus]|uniref:Uncharacterized protein n=1 Tax=Vibrio coralliilyticus TaxID=190893 RepID=A0AAP7DFQ4_9VIBR|nr:hypothetical protein [Vibrio coralliilyticus]NOJ24745.1 hypothetical protein [Vibrio coralliilyticus]
MEFSIKRLKTSLGTFRLKGQLIDAHSDREISFAEAEFMGTDGWVEINTESEGGMAILNQIKPEVIEHLI